MKENRNIQNLLLLVVLSTCSYLACGHVALTFPPARKYDLDFLDNSRTPAPCGMPKGEQDYSQSFFLLLLLFHLFFTSLYVIYLKFKTTTMKKERKKSTFVVLFTVMKCCYWL